jgi:glycosyltransferase involved in cell wall biosynthesis
LRILWLNWRDIKNPDAAGAEVFTHEVCKRLVKKERIESVTLFAAAFDGCKLEELIDGVRIVRGAGKYGVYDKAKEFYNTNKNDFDLVVDEIITKPFNTPSFVHGKPIVALIHQLAREFWFYEMRFPINLLGYYFLERYWLSKYRDISTITMSSSSAEDLRNWSFKKIYVVPHGLSCSPLQMLPEKEIKHTVLFVGTLKKSKKPEDAVRAFRIIKDELPDARLWIIGDGYMKQELREMVKSMFPKEHGDITFFGNQSHDQKLALMSRAHVLVVPSSREGWGATIIESNAMGTPAIAYDVPGLRDAVIDGVTGALVQNEDHVGMAIEAIDILKDHIKRKTYSLNGMRNAKQFDWDKTTTNIHSILMGLTRSRPETAAELSAV